MGKERREKDKPSGTLSRKTSEGKVDSGRYYTKRNVRKTRKKENKKRNKFQEDGLDF